MVKELTPKDFDETIKSGKAVVDFWAPWCGPCRMFAPTFKAVSEEEKEVTFAKVNTEEEENQALAIKYGIRSIPTIIFFQDGEKVDQVTGALPKEMFQEKLKSVFG